MVPRLDAEVQAWTLSRAEDRLGGHETATAAQEARAVVVLTTSVALASLAGLVAATALSVHHDSSVALSASLVAMVGFTLSSTLFLGSLRSGRFSSSGESPSETAGADGGATGLDELRRRRLAEVEACIVENEAMMETRRRLANAGLWTFLGTPVFALVCGWLSA